MPRISHSHESYQSKPPRSKWGTVLARYDRTGALIAWQVFGPIGTFVVLITVARPCGSRRVGLSFLSRGK